MKLKLYNDSGCLLDEINDVSKSALEIALSGEKLVILYEGDTIVIEDVPEAEEIDEEPVEHLEEGEVT